MIWVIWVVILAAIGWLAWNIYTKVVKNEGEELFLKEKKSNPISDIIDEIDY